MSRSSSADDALDQRIHHNLAQRLASPAYAGSEFDHRGGRQRAAMLAKVHVAKKQLGLDDDAYRAVVKRVTGTDSSAAASDAALHRLLAEFGRLGFKATRPGSVRSHKPNVRMIAGLWADLGPHLTDASPDALRAFVRRQTRTRNHPDGVSAPEFLDAAQAARVIEALKAWLARVQGEPA